MIATATAAALTLSLIIVSTATAASYSTPDRNKPRWFTKGFQKKLRKADERGIRLSNERINSACPGVQNGRGVQANAASSPAAPPTSSSPTAPTSTSARRATASPASARGWRCR
jgi:hypothetical protein